MLTTGSSQDLLHCITKIVETECSHDADRLLADGFVLLGVNRSIFDDSENRFVYSLGFPRPLDELPQWVRSSF
jgi:hypothetical protein